MANTMQIKFEHKFLLNGIKKSAFCQYPKYKFDHQLFQFKKGMGTLIVSPYLFDYKNKLNVTITLDKCLII